MGSSRCFREECPLRYRRRRGRVRGNRGGNRSWISRVRGISDSWTRARVGCRARNRHSPLRMAAVCRDLILLHQSGRPAPIRRTISMPRGRSHAALLGVSIRVFRPQWVEGFSTDCFRVGATALRQFRRIDWLPRQVYAALGHTRGRFFEGDRQGDKRRPEVRRERDVKPKMGVSRIRSTC